MSGYKVAKYIIYILVEFEITKEGPTTLYCDNMAVNLMYNSNKLTGEYINKEIWYFDVQELFNQRQVVIEHIRNDLNP